jgi:hypothetical protein
LFKLYIFKKHISENEVVAKMGKMKHGWHRGLYTGFSGESG